MGMVLRAALTLALLAVLAFCAFGFLASFEPPGFLIFRWLYAGVAVLSLIAVVAVWRVRPGK
jgi:hypothetical protein